MQTYQVPKYKHGYTFIELLSVILIIGLFLYLVFPVIKNIIPKEESGDAFVFAGIIEEISRYAIEQREKMLLVLDIDTNSYGVITEQEIEKDADGEWMGEIAFTQIPLMFINAQNSEGEVSSGLIIFLFYPDGSKEYGKILLEEIESGDIFTIFLNPYTISPEVIKGEANFEQNYIF